jgi:hypothetical protein
MEITRPYCFEDGLWPSGAGCVIVPEYRTVAFPGVCRVKNFRGPLEQVAVVIIIKVKGKND